MSKQPLYTHGIVLVVGALMILSTIPDSNSTVSYQIDLPSVPHYNRRWGINFNQADIECLAKNIYFEARGEPVDGQYAVAEVVIHRVQSRRFPHSICDVIHEAEHYKWNPKILIKHRCNFSWFCDHKPDVVKNTKAYKKCLYIATEILTNPEYQNRIPYALYYHAKYARPKWSAKKEQVAIIGNHYFYY